MLNVNLLPRSMLAPGTKIGRLTVVREAGLIPGRKKPAVRLELECECGERVFRAEPYLRQILSDCGNNVFPLNP